MTAGEVARGAGDHAAPFLARLTQEFASTLDIHETLNAAVARCMAHLGAEAGSIFLLEREALVCRACAGPVDVLGLELKPGQGIVGQAVTHNSARIVRDVAADPEFAAMVDADTGFVTRSILCVPLAVRGRPLGALELLNKRGGDGLFAEGDLELATTVAAAAALAIHNARMASELVSQERVRRELELARQIQESLLPRARGGTFPVHGLNLPASEVSGDFYDFMPLADGRVFFALADVAGKGMNAALLMARTTSLLRCLARRTRRVDALLAEVNAEICETATLGMFVTLVAGYLDPATGRVEMANAGHHPPLLRRADGALLRFPAAAPPLGVLPDSHFAAETFELAGGALYLYTDGLTESVAAGVEFGTVGLEALIERFAPLPGAVRLDAMLHAWRASGHTSHDDLTLLLVDGMPDAPCAALSILHHRFLGTPAALGPLRAAIETACRDAGLAETQVGELVLAISEAAANVMRHAYGADGAGEIVLEILNNGDEIEAVLTDFAAPVARERIQPRALEDLRPGGLGTHFMQTLMDSCAWEHLPGGAGNVLRMRRRLVVRGADTSLPTSGGAAR